MFQRPFIGEIEIDNYLATRQIEVVLAGGENYLGSRPLHYEWVKKVYDACVKGSHGKKQKESINRWLRPCALS